MLDLNNNYTIKLSGVNKSLYKWMNGRINLHHALKSRQVSVSLLPQVAKT